VIDISPAYAIVCVCVYVCTSTQPIVYRRGYSDREIERYADREIERYTDREIERYTDREILR
jgi:hypothetical protein